MSVKRNFTFQLEEIRGLSKADIRRRGIEINTVLSDLFNLLYESLWTMETDLRNYVSFEKQINLKLKKFVFVKPDKFEEAPLEDSGINVKFIGSFDKEFDGKILYDQVRRIISGYEFTENKLLQDLRYNLQDISKNCAAVGIPFSNEDLSLLNGVYHSHNFLLTNKDESVQLEACSKLTLFL